MLLFHIANECIIEWLVDLLLIIGSIPVLMEGGKSNMRLYIDPGTGSMLFTILLGVLSAGIYALRNSIIRLRFFFSGGRHQKKQEETDSFIIFSDNKRYWNVFEPICEEFERRGVDLVYMTASPDDPVLQKEYEHVKCEFIGEGNKAFAKLNLLSADILLSTTPGLDVYQWKRSRDVKWYVHIPHASSDLTLYRMFGLDYYDAVLCSGKYQIEQIRKLEALRQLPPKELIITGVTYMDAMQLRRCSLPEKSAPATTVLLAPSWGASGILSKYGNRILDALLATGYHIIVRPHPQSYISEKTMIDTLMQHYADDPQLEWNRDIDNFEVLSRSDLIISDFSGVIFDFSLVFDKPVIYTDTSFDDSPYDACWLEDPLWTFQTLPRIGQQLTEENMPRIKELIDSCLQEPKYQEGRDRARRETWENPGCAASLTVDYLLKKYDQLHNEQAPNG